MSILEEKGIQLYCEENIELSLKKNKYYKLSLFFYLAFFSLLILTPLFFYSYVDIFPDTVTPIVDISIYVILPFFVVLLNISWIYDYLYYCISTRTYIS
ncbi:MAG: hypothetical protein ACTSW1_13760 [Candidatus Hodarchaeales archaeon]